MDEDGRERDSPSTMPLWQMKREVFDHSRIAIIQRDFGNHVLYANAAALAMSGVGRVEEMRLDVLFQGKAAQVLDEETRGRRERQLGAYSALLTRQDDPSRQVAVEVTGIPLVDDAGAVTGSLGIFRSLEHQALTEQLRELTLSLAGSPELLPRMAAALATELPFDLMLVSRVIADADSWESEIVFNHPPFEQRVPRAWYSLSPEQRLYMESTRGRIRTFDRLMDEPPWDVLADEPLFVQMREMALRSSMWRRIVRREGDVDRTVAILTLLSRDANAYDEQQQALFNRLPLVETVLGALDSAERRRERRELRMFRELNRAADIQSACGCLAMALVEIFDWAHVSIFRVDAARDAIVLISSARRGTDGTASDTGMVWGDYRQPVDVGVLGRVVASGAASSVPDVSKDADFLAPPGDTSVRSELAVPIAFAPGERVRFVISADDPRLNAFSRDHVRQLMAIAGEVAGSLDRISELTMLQECVDNVSDPVIATDAKLGIRRVNQAAEALFDARREALLGRCLIELFDDPQPLVALLAGTDARNRLGELTVRRAPLEGASADEAPTSVFVTRRDFPGNLGGHVFIARDLGPMRRSVQLEFLERTAYELAVETQAPLGLAMSYLEGQLESSVRPCDAPAARPRDLQAVLRQLGRVKHAFTRLALYNREAREAARAVRVVRLDGELQALLASLTAPERDKVLFDAHDVGVSVKADPVQLHIVVESLLSALLRAAAEDGRVRMTLNPDGDRVFLTLYGRLPPARRGGARFGAPEAAEGDLRLANPLLLELMRNQGGELIVTRREGGETQFKLVFREGGSRE